ncbi:MAG TPA: PAS domain S-box protein [Burkholderiaceae bacterium]
MPPAPSPASPSAQSAQADRLSAPPRPAFALPPRPALRRGVWALPLVISLLFVAAALLWLRHSEQADLEQQRQDLITDALSLEAQISGNIERESLQLADLARRLPPGTTPAAFVTLPDVQRGLQRFWVSITWLDATNRIVAHLPEQAPRPDAAQIAAGTASPSSVAPGVSRGSSGAGSGLTAHLAANIPGGGSLVARYSPTAMLRQNVPWWLTRKYDVRLVDSFDDVIASTTDGADDAGDRASHRIDMSATLGDAALELIARDRIAPWYRGLPVTMVAGFVVLIGAITWLLRRQVRGVARAEAAWRTEAAWRSAMEDSLTVALRARDLHGRLVYVNRTLAEMIGYAPEELVGLMPPMPYWPTDSIGEIMQRHQRNLAGQAPREGYEARWRHRDGRILDVMVFEAPLVDASGTHIGWMGSILDITARKGLEERERRHAEAMAHHARLTMLGEIAATLAHELNQPLTAISSYNAGVVNSLQRAGATTDPVVLGALRRLGEQAAHAGRIVQRIREFLTRREPQLEACAPGAIVEGAVALLRRELERRGIVLRLALDPRLPAIVADAVLVEQVVINLVRNASDALAERGEADGASGERHIDVRGSISADARFVRLDVSDNGPGLQGRRIETLCAPFYSTKADGMGMGLAICRSILEAHQGVLDASEAPGGGACFSISLPVRLASDTNPKEEEADVA